MKMTDEQLEKHKKYMEENNVSSMVFGDMDRQLGNDGEVYFLDEFNEDMEKFITVIEDENWEKFKNKVVVFIEVNEMEYANKLNQVRDIVEKYKSIEPSDLVGWKFYNDKIDAKVFLDKESEFLGIRKDVIYHKM